MYRKHLLLMVVGCLLPLIALISILVFQIKVSSLVLFGLILLCPMMHLWMMRDHTKHQAVQETIEKPELIEPISRS